MRQQRAIKRDPPGTRHPTRIQPSTKGSQQPNAATLPPDDTSTHAPTQQNACRPSQSTNQPANTLLAAKLPTQTAGARARTTQKPNKPENRKTRKRTPTEHRSAKQDQTAHNPKRAQTSPAEPRSTRHLAPRTHNASDTQESPRPASPACRRARPVDEQRPQTASQ